MQLGESDPLMEMGRARIGLGRGKRYGGREEVNYLVFINIPSLFFVDIRHRR
jgi:hypothetical protein